MRKLKIFLLIFILLIVFVVGFYFFNQYKLSVPMNEYKISPERKAKYERCLIDSVSVWGEMKQKNNQIITSEEKKQQEEIAKNNCAYIISPPL